MQDVTPFVLEIEALHINTVQFKLDYINQAGYGCNSRRLVMKKLMALG